MKVPTMTTFSWRSLYAWLLAAFFVFGGTLNILASPEILADYQRWGYPSGFNYVTGACEWTTAVLVAMPRTRLIGSLLGAAVMTGAAGTVLLAGEYSHAIPPAIVLALTLLNAALAAAAARRRADPLRRP